MEVTRSEETRRKMLQEKGGAGPGQGPSGWGVLSRERLLPAAWTRREATLAAPSCRWSPSSCLAAARLGLGM